MSYIDSTQEAIAKIEYHLHRIFDGVRRELRANQKASQDKEITYYNKYGEVLYNIDWKYCYYDDEGYLRDYRGERIYTSKDYE